MYLCNDNRVLTDTEKKKMLKEGEKYFKKFLQALRIDVDNDPNSKDTPKRVTKMYVNELFKGRYEDCPEIRSFPNAKKYDQIIFSNCDLQSVCSHHFAVIKVKVFIGILSNPDPNSRLIGLSKYTRLAEWIFARPTIQEDATSQLHDLINSVCENNLGIMIYVIGEHGCCTSRGVKQKDSKMITSRCSGKFQENSSVKEEFMNMVNNSLGMK